MTNNKNKLPPFPDDEVLFAFLAGKANATDEAALLAAMEESDFLKDAVEGLSNEGDGNALRAAKQKLQAKLKEQLAPRRKALSPAQVLVREHWIWLAVVLVLILVLSGYWVLQQVLAH